MAEQYIDTLEVPVPTTAPGVQISCPLGSSSVGVTFHVNVNFASPDTDVADCHLAPASGTRARETSSPPPGNQVTFKFSSVAAGVYSIFAKGNVTAEQSIGGITVSGDGVDPCPVVSTTALPSPSPYQITALVFSGKRPVDTHGNPTPLRISGKPPFSFTFGGKIPGQDKLPKVTLVPEKESDGNNVVAPTVKAKGNRWSSEFKNVTPGNYTLKVGDEPNLLDSYRIIIRTR
jgi:hypothetical protein